MFVLDGEADLPPCHENPELWFSTRKTDIERAKTICKHDCKMQLICLYQALDFEKLSGEPLHGVRGGLTPEERITTTLTRVS